MLLSWFFFFIGHKQNFVVTVVIAFNRRRNLLAQTKSSNTELALSQCAHGLGCQSLVTQELSHSCSSVPTAPLSGKISLHWLVAKSNSLLIFPPRQHPQQMESPFSQMLLVEDRIMSHQTSESGIPPWIHHCDWGAGLWQTLFEWCARSWVQNVGSSLYEQAELRDIGMEVPSEEGVCC